MCRFSARVNDGRSVVVNSFIIGPDSFWFGECLAVASNVCGFRLNEVDLIVDHSCFVVRNLEEERSDCLLKSFEVGVGPLSNDWFEVDKGVGEFRHDILGRHSAPKIVQPLSCGSDAAVFDGLGKHGY